MFRVTFLIATIGFCIAYPDTRRILPENPFVINNLSILPNPTQSTPIRKTHEVEYIIKEVENMLKQNPSLPRLTKGEIIDLLENITKADLTKQRDPKALMLVMPFTPQNNNQQNIEEFYTKKPVTHIVGSDNKQESFASTKKIKKVIRRKPIIQPKPVEEVVFKKLPEKDFIIENYTIIPKNNSNQRQSNGGLGFKKLPNQEFLGLKHLFNQENLGFKNIPNQENLGFKNLPNQENLGFKNIPNQANIAFQKLPNQDNIAFKKLPNQDNLSFKKLPNQESLGFQKIPNQDNTGFKKLPNQANLSFKKMPNESLKPQQQNINDKLLLDNINVQNNQKSNFKKIQGLNLNTKLPLEFVNRDTSTFKPSLNLESINKQATQFKVLNENQQPQIKLIPENTGEQKTIFRFKKMPVIANKPRDNEFKLTEPATEMYSEFTTTERINKKVSNTKTSNKNNNVRFNQETINFKQDNKPVSTVKTQTEAPKKFSARKRITPTKKIVEITTEKNKNAEFNVNSGIHIVDPPKFVPQTPSIFQTSFKVNNNFNVQDENIKHVDLHAILSGNKNTPSISVGNINEFLYNAHNVQDHDDIIIGSVHDIDRLVYETPIEYNVQNNQPIYNGNEQKKISTNKKFHSQYDETILNYNNPKPHFALKGVPFFKSTVGTTTTTTEKPLDISPVANNLSQDMQDLLMRFGLLPSPKNEEVNEPAISRDGQDELEEYTESQFASEVHQINPSSYTNFKKLPSTEDAKDDMLEFLAQFGLTGGSRSAKAVKNNDKNSLFVNSNKKLNEEQKMSNRKDEIPDQQNTNSDNLNLSNKNDETVKENTTKIKEAVVSDKLDIKAKEISNLKDEYNNNNQNNNNTGSNSENINVKTVENNNKENINLEVENENKNVKDAENNKTKQDETIIYPTLINDNLENAFKQIINSDFNVENNNNNKQNNNDNKQNNNNNKQNKINKQMIDDNKQNYYDNKQNNSNDNKQTATINNNEQKDKNNSLEVTFKNTEHDQIYSNSDFQEKFVFNPNLIEQASSADLIKLNKLMTAIKELEKLNGTATEEDLKHIDIDGLKELLLSLNRNYTNALDNVEVTDTEFTTSPNIENHKTNMDKNLNKTKKTNDTKNEQDNGNVHIVNSISVVDATQINDQVISYSNKVTNGENGILNSQNAPNPIDFDLGLSKNEVKRQESTTVSTTSSVSSTTTSSSTDEKNANIAALDDSFGGTKSVTEGTVVEETTPARKTGFYYLLDWNSFFDIDNQKGKRVNLRFQPKVGDPKRFYSVSVP